MGEKKRLPQIHNEPGEPGDTAIVLSRPEERWVGLGRSGSNNESFRNPNPTAFLSSVRNIGNLLRNKNQLRKVGGFFYVTGPGERGDGADGRMADGRWAVQ